MSKRRTFGISLDGGHHRPGIGVIPDFDPEAFDVSELIDLQYHLVGVFTGVEAEPPKEITDFLESELEKIKKMREGAQRRHEESGKKYQEQREKTLIALVEIAKKL